MSDDCMHLHGIISMALDGEPVDPGELDAAKAHCGSCPECARFVSGLARLGEVPTPEVPEPTISILMARVRAEAEANAEAERREQEQAATAETDGAVLTSVATERRPEHSRWIARTGWIAGGLAAVLVAAVVTVQGARYLSGAATSVADAPKEIASGSSEGDAGTTFGSSEGDAASQSQTSLTPESGSTADRDMSTTKSAPPYVAFGGFVYEVGSRAQRVSGDPGVLGSVESAFDGSSVIKRVVFASDTPSEILIEDGEDMARPATPVTREYSGTTYRLQSGPISAFGQWPTLPASISAPERQDGSPTFAESGERDGSVELYVVTGTTTASGFAIAPGSPESDPAAGNPNWTWWTPAP